MNIDLNDSTVRYYLHPNGKIYKYDNIVYFWLGHCSEWRESLVNIDVVKRDCTEISKDDLVLELI